MASPFFVMLVKTFLTRDIQSNFFNSFMLSGKSKTIAFFAVILLVLANG